MVRHHCKELSKSKFLYNGQRKLEADFKKKNGTLGLGLCCVCDPPPCKSECICGEL